MFIGRSKELNFLNKAYNSDKAEFITLYGRRRVGKTETLKEFCKGKPHIMYSCNQYTDNKQFAKFTSELLDYNPELRKQVKVFSDWEDAFSRLPSLAINGEKLILVIDEFPYMVKGDSSIPSVLQNLWDNKLKDSNIMIVLSGSSISFIEDELLAAKNPLYGRMTGICKMLPMPFHDAIKFFPDYSDEDKFLAYSILGGIPHYLKQFNPNVSVEENIKNEILTSGTTLYGEVEHILHQELREVSSYNNILEAIAFGANKFNEICEKAMIDGNNISPYLRNLTEIGLLTKELPVTATPKEITKRNQGEYKIADNFFRFWYTFAFPFKSLIDDGQVDNLLKNVVLPRLHSFASKEFENVSIYYLNRLNADNLTPFWFCKIGRWWGKVTQKDENGKLQTTSEELDVVAYDIDEKNYIVGECKLTNQPFDLNELKNLKRKARFNGNIFYYLFSLNGFTNAVLSEKENSSDVFTVTLSDIIKLAQQQ